MTSPLDAAAIEQRLLELVDRQPGPLWPANHLAQAALRAALRAAGDPDAPTDPWAAFLALRPGWEQDTWMGRPTRVAAYAPRWRAVARARALAECIEELEGQLEGQPLRVSVAPVEGALERRPLPPGPVPIGVLERGRLVIMEPAGRDLAELHAELCRRLEGRAPEPARVVRLPAVVQTAPSTLEDAMHVHRRGGLLGPWLGATCAEGLDVLSTRHLVIDGFGHEALLSRWRRRSALLLEEAEAPPGAALPVAPAIPGPPVGLLRYRRPAGPRFVALARAHGGALTAARALIDPSWRGRAHSPTFTVPFLPRGGDGWRRQRVIPALLSVRLGPDGAPEPLASFQARLDRSLALAGRGRGLIQDSVRKFDQLPLPRRLRPLWMRLVDLLAVADGPVGYMSGSGMVSYLRLEEGQGDCWAASWPPPMRDRWLGPGGIGNTLIRQGDELCVTLIGSGGSAAPEALERYQERFERLLATG